MNLVCVIYVTLLTKLFVVSWEPPAIAQWIRLHQPFCGPAFESQTYISSTLFQSNIVHYLHRVEKKDENKQKEVWFSPYFDCLWKRGSLICCFTMISFIAPVLMFSIIWYENNGCTAHYRTVINILLCNTCIINTLRGFVTRVPHAIMIIFSPMSMTFCDGILHD